MIPLGLTLALAASPVVEIQGGEGCVDAASVEAAITRDGPTSVARSRLRIQLRRQPSVVLAHIRILSPRGEDQRTLELGPSDCPLLPILVARIYRRYAENLPQLEPLLPVPPNELYPRWFERQRVFFLVSAGFEGLRLPRLGVHGGLARGPLGSVQWVAVGGYDAIVDRPAGEGRFSLHRVWAATGIGAELGEQPMSAAAELVVGGGAALALARQLDVPLDPVLPVVLLRLQTRLRWPGGTRGPRPSVGLTGELGLLRPRLEAPGGTYEEPLFRVELNLGLGWGDVW